MCLQCMPMVVAELEKRELLWMLYLSDHSIRVARDNENAIDCNSDVCAAGYVLRVGCSTYQ